MAEVIYKRRFGDRKEGRQLRSLNPFDKFIPYIMVKRNDACNQFEDALDITYLDGWFRDLRQKGYKGIGMLHLFIAAYIRTVAHCPSLNRFVSGQKVFARRNIEVVMAVKRNLSTDGGETTIKVRFEPTDTIFDVYRKLNEKIDEIKANDGDNNTEQTAASLCKLPGLILKFAVWVLNLMDYFDLLPQALLDASPFHGSMIISDLGSIGIPPVYHHIYNFGNLPLFICFGSKRKAWEPDGSGQFTEHRYIDYKVVTDERICDGFSYAKAFGIMKHYLKNPAALTQPPKEVAEDIF